MTPDEVVTHALQHRRIRGLFYDYIEILYVNFTVEERYRLERKFQLECLSEKPFQDGISVEYRRKRTDAAAFLGYILSMILSILIVEYIRNSL